MKHEDGPFERRLEIRRDVLGAEYVDASIAACTDFNRPLHELVAGYCLGDGAGTALARPPVRSLISVAMLAALSHQHELQLHVTGALRNGATPEEVHEVLLQAAVYCGVPAAVDAFRTAKEAIDTHGPASGEPPAAAPDATGAGP